jgi:hypothetical protein
MQGGGNELTTVEAGRVLDALAALSIRLSCHCDVAPDTLVLNAAKVREACNAIDDAVDALKRILAVTDASGTSIVVESAGTSPPRKP